MKIFKLVLIAAICFGPAAIAQTLGFVPAIRTFDPSRGPVAAVVGDSIGISNIASASGQKMFSSRGAVTWLRFLSGQAINTPYANNLAVAGTTLAQIATTVPTALALSPKPNILFINGGTNDVTNGTSFTSMQSSMLGMIRQAVSAGVVPVVKTIPPYTGLTSDKRLLLNRYNNWLRALGSGRADLLTAAGLPVGYAPIVIDATASFVDSTSTTGAIQSSLSTDNVTHPNSAGSQIEGLLMQSALGSMLPPRPTRAQNGADVYDATKNPMGNLLNNAGTNAGLFTGTGGTLTTLTGVTPSGSLATSWQGFRNTGTSTATLSFSKENPRTDVTGSNGERQIITISSNSGGSAYETYSIRMPVVAGTFSVGDTVYAEMGIEVVSATNLVSATLYLYENGPATPNNNSDMNDNSAGGTLKVTSFNGILRTEPFVIQSGTTNIYIQLNINTKSDTGTAAAVVKASDASVRKVTY